MIHYIQREGSISNVQNKRNAEIFDVMQHVIDYYKEKQRKDLDKEEQRKLRNIFGLRILNGKIYIWRK